MMHGLATRFGVSRSAHRLTTQRLCGSQSQIKEQIKGQYDSTGAVIFYKTVMGGGEGNIHYGIATKPAGQESVKELSRNTVNFMGTVLQTMTLGRLGKETTLVDVGSGHGGAAHDNIKRFGCKVVGFNLCERQNAEAEAEARRLGLGDLFSARQGDFDQEGFPEEWKERFDAAWSEEVFCHSVDKPALLKRVAAILKPGGSLVFTDIMAGEAASAEDLQTFTDRNATSTMFRPSDYIAALNDAGLKLVNFTDLTEHLPFFFNGMIRQIDENVEDMVSKGVDRDYIGNFRGSLVSRVEAHSRGCFAFGVFGAKKPSGSGTSTGTALGLGSRQKGGASGVSSFQISGRTYSTSSNTSSHSLPKAILIVGGGCIGTDLASIFSNLPNLNVLVKVGSSPMNPSLRQLCEAGKVDVCQNLPDQLERQLVLVAVKTYSHARVSEELVNRLPSPSETTERPRICFIHNGYMDYPAKLNARAMTSQIMAVGSWSRNEEGRVLSHKPESLWFMRDEYAANFYRYAGLNPCTESYQLRRLEKFLVNGVANLMAVRYGKNCAGLLNEHKVEMEAIFDEMYAILRDEAFLASAWEEAPPFEEFKKATFERLAMYGTHYPSTKGDFDAGNPLEIDSLNGYITYCANAQGVTAPVNSRLCDHVREMVSIRDSKRTPRSASPASPSLSPFAHSPSSGPQVPTLASPQRTFSTARKVN